MIIDWMNEAILEFGLKYVKCKFHYYQLYYRQYIISLEMLAFRRRHID